MKATITLIFFIAIFGYCKAQDFININNGSEIEKINNSSSSTSDNKSFTSNKTVEFGGNISFYNQNSIGSSRSITMIAFSPYIGIMVANGFELGFIPEIVYSSRSYETNLNLFFTPSYNINAGKIYPFIEFLIGYNSINIRNSYKSGFGIGGTSGVKFQIGDNSLIVFGLRFLHQSFGSSGYSASNYYNTFSVNIGVHFFIPSKK